MTDTQAKPQARTRPTRTPAEYLWTIKNIHSFAPEICIDVGAANGTMAIYRAFPHALHIAIEPIPEMIPQLSKALEGVEHTIFQVAAMDAPGVRSLRRAKNPLTSSLFAKSESGSADDMIEVRVTTIDQLMEPYAGRGPLLLKTDCQGTDLMALQGAKHTLNACEVVIVEASMFRFWGPQQPDFYDIVHFMKENGFVVHDFIDGLFRPRDRALGQIDIAFVKETGMFRTRSTW